MINSHVFGAYGFDERPDLFRKEVIIPGETKTFVFIFRRTFRFLRFLPFDDLTTQHLSFLWIRRIRVGDTDQLVAPVSILHLMGLGCELELPSCTPDLHLTINIENRYSSSLPVTLRLAGREWYKPVGQITSRVTTEAQYGLIKPFLDSPIYCEHANECPQICPCPEHCYCKAPGNTCSSVERDQEP